MAIDLIRGRWRRRPAGEAPVEAPPLGLAIGEDLPVVASCPACGRPLDAQNGVCAGCGARLILGVQARRAAAFASFGLITGILVGAFAMGVISSATRSLPASAGSGTGGTPAATSGAAASAPVAGSSGGPTIQAAATNALRQAAIIDARLATTYGELRTALSMKPFDTGETAQVLRDLAADAANGSQLLPGLAAWPAAATVQAELAAFYDGVLATARDGLAYSLADAAGYRSAGSAMVVRFKALPAIDASARRLAATVGLELPVLDLP